MAIATRSIVVSGRGWASKDRLEETCALAAIEGQPFVQGSLNLIAKKPIWLDVESAIYRQGTHIFWRASLEGLPVVIGRWLSGCPAHVFEVFASVRLRDSLMLKDGDIVTLEIPEASVAKRDASWVNRMVWNLFWRFRERHIYRDGFYLSLISSRFVRPYAWRGMQRR
jgi:hypothetical protein